MLNEVNEGNNDKKDNDVEVEEATNKTTNETTNATYQTTNNSNSLATIVLDNSNQALLQSPQLKRAAPLTTARKKSSNEKKKAFKAKKGCRIKVTRNNLYHVLNETQQVGLEKFGNSRNFHGNIISGSGKQGNKVKFDDLPSDDQIVYVKRRNVITVVDLTEEE